MEDNDLNATKEFNFTDEVDKSLKLDDKKESEEELEVVVFDKKDKKLNKKKKEKKLKKLWKKFKELKTKWKVLIIISVILLISGIIVLSYFLLNKKKADIKPLEEEKIVIKDNFYYKAGKLYILDVDDKEIGEYECSNKDEKNCYVAYELNEDDFNQPIKEFEDGEKYYPRSKVYHNRYVFIFDNEETDGPIVLYDLETKSNVSEYLGVKSYKTENVNYVVLESTSKKYGLSEISETGIRDVLKFDYDYMGIIDSHETVDSVVVKNSEKWSIVSFEGKVLLRDSNFQIKNFNKGFAMVVNDTGKYYAISYNKTPVINVGYKYMELLDDYAIVVDDSDYLKVIDYESNKMMEVGFKLEVADFVRRVIYKEDGEVKESKYAYSYELNGEMLNLKISNGTSDTLKQVNLMEGNISKNYNYYSYFDGSLYFYLDSEKTELIGTYKCDNLNTLSSSSKEFDKCMISSDENVDDNDMVGSLNVVSMTPIYNNRFVFVRDAKSLATDNEVKIKLYDLVDKSAPKISYVSVNTYSSKDSLAVNHESVNYKIVVAKNQSGKYGAIEIDSDSVNPAINFEYSSLEKIGDTYYSGKKDNKWFLLDAKGNTIGEFNEQIRGYNSSYVKTKASGKYKIYKIDGSSVNNKTYKYIDLFSTSYYAAVDDDNKVAIYEYSGNQISQDLISINSTDYYGTSKNAFKVQLLKDRFELSILIGNEYKVYSFNLDGSRMG